MNFEKDITYNPNTCLWVVKVYYKNELLRTWRAETYLKAQIIANNFIINETLAG